MSSVVSQAAGHAQGAGQVANPRAQALAAPHDEAPITCQFMVEDHAVRHSYHDLAGIRAALKR